MPIAAISLALGVVKLITWAYATFWGKAPRLEAKIAYFEMKKAMAKAERARLKDAYKAIDEAPKKTGDALLKDFDDTWNRKP